jgi:DNA-binding IscR family transcriptional regulator
MMVSFVQGDHAVRVTVDLAEHLDEAPVRRAQIQGRQDVPAAYLAKIVPTLARAGLVRRGPARAGASDWPSTPRP